jgi:metallo-beta-lactamase family protein
MKITFHGAARTVTGSQHLLEVNDCLVLLDCGLYQGRRGDTYQRNLNFPFDPKKLDAVILSHAHIDHSGNLPNLVKCGYSGPIHATSATAHLANIMLMDSAHIQEIDAQYVSKKNAKKGLPPVEPLYTVADASLVAQNFATCDYDEPFEVVAGVTVSLVDAGHILGSAAVVMDIEENGHGTPSKKRLWFSGDIGRRDLPLLRDPVLPRQADWMIMECTYGDKPHSDPRQAMDELRKVVNRTINRGGKLIIPAFAVGRTQDLIYDLHLLMDGGQIPSVPVIVDSPLAVNASDIYRAHPECFDEETQKFIAQDKHRAILGFERLTFTRTVEESKALNARREPMIIISAAGMAENGRIRHHLVNNIENPANTILIVSWQAPETLGRRLADRDERVTIFGESYKVRAEVATIGGLSAHAGQDLLMEYAQATQSTVQKIYLVHGEPVPAQTLTARLGEKGLRNIQYPDLHESVEI